MKLRVHDNSYGKLYGLFRVFFPSYKQKLLRLTFPLVIKDKDINLDSKDATLVVWIEGLERDCGGATAPFIKNNTVFMRLSRRQSLSSLLKSFSHEMVHVRQILDKQLAQDENNVMWKGEKMSKNKVRAAVELASCGGALGIKSALGPYENLPWEKEAYELGPQIYKRIKQHLATIAVRVALNQGIESDGREAD